MKGISVGHRPLRSLKVLNDTKYARLLVLCEDLREQFEKWRGFEEKRELKS